MTEHGSDAVFSSNQGDTKMAQALRIQPNLVEDAVEAKRYLDLAEAAERCAREWRTRAKSLLPITEATLLRAVERIALDAHDDAPKTRRKRERASTAVINAMIKESQTSTDGMTAVEMQARAEWTRTPYPSDLGLVAKRRGLRLAVLDPRPGSNETRYRFI